MCLLSKGAQYIASAPKLCTSQVHAKCPPPPTASGRALFLFFLHEHIVQIAMQPYAVHGHQAHTSCCYSITLAKAAHIGRTSGRPTGRAASAPARPAAMHPGAAILRCSGRPAGRVCLACCHVPRNGLTLSCPGRPAGRAAAASARPAAPAAAACARGTRP